MLFSTMHVHTIGKQEGRSPAMASVVENTLNSLLFANDQLTGRAFLIDSGAEVSVLPASVADRKNKVKVTFCSKWKFNFHIWKEIPSLPTLWQYV